MAKIKTISDFRYEEMRKPPIFLDIGLDDCYAYPIGDFNIMRSILSGVFTKWSKPIKTLGAAELPNLLIEDLNSVDREKAIEDLRLNKTPSLPLADAVVILSNSYTDTLRIPSNISKDLTNAIVQSRGHFLKSLLILGARHIFVLEQTPILLPGTVNHLGWRDIDWEITGRMGMEKIIDHKAINNANEYKPGSVSIVFLNAPFLAIGSNSERRMLPYAKAPEDFIETDGYRWTVKGQQEVWLQLQRAIGAWRWKYLYSSAPLSYNSNPKL